MMLPLPRFHRHEPILWRVTVAFAGFLALAISALKAKNISLWSSVYLPTSISQDLIGAYKHGAFFYFCLPVLAVALCYGVRLNASRAHTWSAFPLALVSFLILSCFAPLDHHGSGLAEMGNWHYFPMSRTPVTYEHEFTYRRILMPSLFSLTGGESSIDFRNFSFALVVITFAVVIILFEGPLRRTSVAFRLLFYTSLFSSSFGIQTLQLPGYPDILLMLIILILAYFRTTTGGRAALVAMALCTHDGAGLILLPLAICYMNRGQSTLTLLMTLSFYSFGALDSLLENSSPLTDHHVIGPGSGFANVMEKPAIFVCAIFFGFKLLWIPVLTLWVLRGGTTLWVRESILFLGPLVVLMLAWDTSRLTSFSIAGFIFYLRKIASSYGSWPRSMLTQTCVALFLLANLVLPTRFIFMHVAHTHNSYPGSGWYKEIYDFSREHLPDPLNWVINGY